MICCSGILISVTGLISITGLISAGFALGAGGENPVCAECIELPVPVSSVDFVTHPDGVVPGESIAFDDDCLTLKPV